MKFEESSFAWPGCRAASRSVDHRNTRGCFNKRTDGVRLPRRSSRKGNMHVKSTWTRFTTRKTLPTRTIAIRLMETIFQGAYSPRIGKTSPLQGNFVIISPPAEARLSAALSRSKNDAEALLSGLNISCPSSLSIEELLTDDFYRRSTVLGYQLSGMRVRIVWGIFRARQRHIWGGKAHLRNQ